MKFTRTGTYQENELEKLNEQKPLEKIQTIILKRLNYILGFISKENPKAFKKYVQKLTEKYQGLVKEDFVSTYSGDIKEILSDFENLKKYPELATASMNYYIQLLQLPDKKDWLKEKVEVTTKAELQSFLFPSYYLALTLTETIEREQAVKLFKKYVTQYFIDNKSPNRDKFVSLAKNHEKRTTGDTTSSSWVMVHSMIADGKYAYKNENCSWVKVTKELPDTELKYLVCCYGDYEAAKAFNDDNIILTMEHTIAQGDPYCSRVLHDTRIDYDLRHPPKEFWDNFVPGKEEEAKKHYKK
jgi:hypothetical protein